MKAAFLKQLLVKANNYSVLAATTARGPLCCSAPQLKYILTYNQVMASTLNLLFELRERTTPLHTVRYYAEDELSRGYEWPEVNHLCRSGVRIQHAFNLLGFEGRSERDEQDEPPWKMTHITVYHSFDVKTGRSFWLLAKEEPATQEIQDEFGSFWFPYTANDNKEIIEYFGTAFATHYRLFDWALKSINDYIDTIEPEVRKLQDDYQLVGRDEVEPTDAVHSNKINVRRQYWLRCVADRLESIDFVIKQDEDILDEFIDNFKLNMGYASLKEVGIPDSMVIPKLHRSMHRLKIEFKSPKNRVESLLKTVKRCEDWVSLVRSSLSLGRLVTSATRWTASCPLTSASTNKKILVKLTTPVMTALNTQTIIASIVSTVGTAPKTKKNRRRRKSRERLKRPPTSPKKQPKKEPILVSPRKNTPRIKIVHPWLVCNIMKTRVTVVVQQGKGDGALGQMGTSP